MSELIEGFFDELQDPEFKLWTSNVEPYLSEETVIAVAEWAKRSKKMEDLAERCFFLTKHHLYYKKSPTDTKIRGSMSLEFVRVACEGDQLEENGELIFKIKLTRNLRYTEISTRNKEVYLHWKELLCPLTIQTDFHTKYHVMKKIGKGAFASVYLV
jgi:hypothetical protein